MSAVGNIIKERLDEKGWSIRELARRSDLPQATVHKIITGETLQPRMVTLKQIAQPLGLSVTSLGSAAAHDAGYITTPQDPDGFGLLVAGVRSLSKPRQAEVAALVEAMLTSNRLEVTV